MWEPSLQEKWRLHINYKQALEKSGTDKIIDIKLCYNNCETEAVMMMSSYGQLICKDTRLKCGLSWMKSSANF